MTSEKVMLTGKSVTLAALCVLLLGCETTPRASSDPEAGALISPYRSRRVWAVVPLANESGTQRLNSLQITDHLARQLETATHIDVLPLNRVIKAMELLRMAEVRNLEDAQQLMKVLGADGLVIGAITSYDPYDPPVLGMTIELYTDWKVEAADEIDLRDMSTAATPADGTTPQPVYTPQPSTTVSAVFDASQPNVREALKRYATGRGGQDLQGEGWHRYRISMDLYTEFVGYVMSWRLLQQEKHRLEMARIKSAS